MVNLGKDRYSIVLNIDLNLVKSRKEKPATYNKICLKY
jgi:hypothetical protein